MSGRVCEKHQEFCPDGICRWCPPAREDGSQFVVPFSKDFVKCHCGEYMFDTRVIPPGMPLEGVGQGSMHTPARCTKNPALVAARPLTSEEFRAVARLSETLESKRFYFHGVLMETDPKLGPDEFRWGRPEQGIEACKAPSPSPGYRCACKRVFLPHTWNLFLDHEGIDHGVARCVPYQRNP